MHPNSILNMQQPAPALGGSGNRRNWPWSDLVDGSPPPTCLVAVSLELDVVPAITMSKQVMWGDVCVAAAAVWSCVFSDRESAHLRYDWIANRPYLLAYWACHAEHFGGERFERLIEEGLRIDAACDRSAEGIGMAVSEEVLGPSVEMASHVVDRHDRHGRQGLASRGRDADREIRSILYNGKGQREGSGDWWARHRDPLPPVASFIRANAAEALEGLVDDGMLQTERGMRKVGMDPGGRLPLRFRRDEE